MNLGQFIVRTVHPTYLVEGLSIAWKEEAGYRINADLVKRIEACKHVTVASSDCPELPVVWCCTCGALGRRIADGSDDIVWLAPDFNFPMDQ